MGNPFRWWWQRHVRRRWADVLLGAAYVGLGVEALIRGADSVAGYLWIGTGCLGLCVAAAAWAYRRRHPLRKEPWYDNLYG